MKFKWFRGCLQRQRLDLPRPIAWAALAAALMLSPGSRCLAGGVVLPAGSTVAGQSIGQWSANWWQWAYSFATPNDPFSDSTGANANLGQSGPVFFLGGTPGGSAERTFDVPAGAYLLVPLLNGELSQLEIGFDKTAAQVREAAREQANLIDSLHATINGSDVPNLFDHREVSPDFQFTAAAGNAFGAPAGDSGVAVADGYYLMLTPLAVGEHLDIAFGGGISAFGFSVDVLDHITAVPEPSSIILAGCGAIFVFCFCRRRAA